MEMLRHLQKHFQNLRHSFGRNWQAARSAFQGLQISQAAGLGNWAGKPHGPAAAPAIGRGLVGVHIFRRQTIEQ
jgi:hypothetical protein